ncbi:hypothetical protein ACEPPN_007033 [Leptodophora sp. 'Broadleaf-Isolate-01']
MHLFCLLVVVIASLLAVVEASLAQGYQLIFYYETYKIDFLINGAGRQLGLTCGRRAGNSVTTTELATFNEFAACNLDVRGTAPRSYRGGPEGDTTTPDVDKVAPYVQQWGYLSSNPGKLVGSWGGATQNDDPYGGGQINKMVADILWDVKETDPSKVPAQALTNINRCLVETINIKEAEQKQAYLKALEKEMPKWARNNGYPAGQIQVNTIIDNGVEIANVDAPLKSNGASVDVQWLASAELAKFNEVYFDPNKRYQRNTISHERVLKMTYDAWKSLRLQHC